ncbi:MAG: DUF4404 family protein [Pontiellaceae bacterium]|nr:DUF4404 family protein [Pontiellaceae bacterium]MBN2786628.1 DUF4404 family protein [Pontiellaceae bacterium]
MPHKEIRESIGQLKQELEQTPKETSQFEELLDHAREGLERYTPDAVQDFMQALQREASEFEVEHPQITMLINQITTALSNLGI